MFNYKIKKSMFDTIRVIFTNEHNTNSEDWLLFANILY